MQPKRNIKPDRYYKQTREDMLEFVPRQAKKVLDVGCGEGFFGESLKSRFNMEVWGIEIASEAAEKAKARLDRVLVGDIENNDINLTHDYFDCIIFNDVLEHLKDPWAVLSSVQKNLTEGGLIVASIPNVRYYRTVKNLIVHKEWEYQDKGILDRTHLRFFTKKSIKSMFEGCGYRVILLKGMRYKKFPWLFGLLNKIFLNALEDMRYKQFVCLSQKVEKHK